MATYSAVTAGEKNADSPITVSLIDKLDQNPHAIAEGASGAPKIQSAALDSNVVTQAKMATDSVGQDEIISGSVHQGGLDTGMSEVSTASSGADLTLPGGEYGFYPQVKTSGVGSGTGYAQICSDFTNASYITNIKMSVGGGTKTVHAQQRYVNSSPPHKIESVDYMEFIFVHLTSSGDVVSCWIATDPPWYHNGPTKVSPNIKKEKGKKFRRDRIIPKELLAIKSSDPGEYYKKVKNLDYTEYEITSDIKNADMPLIPHPFRSAPAGDQIVLIEPNQSGVYMQVCDLFKQGESICELLHAGFLKIDNADIPVKGKPPGVGLHRIKWANTR